MSLTFGFFNSISHDRKYNANHFSRLFDGLVNDGVFASVGTSLVVTASTGMKINVGAGRAWFNHTWTDNDALLPLTVSPAEMTLNRIDAVVLEVNTSDTVRANSIKIIKGTPAGVPINPAMTQTETVQQHPLCYIYVGAAVTTITQANITNKVGTVDCPFITGILQTITTEGLTALFEEEWNTWFDTIKGQLDGDIAGGLQNQINALQEEVTEGFSGLDATTIGIPTDTAALYKVSGAAAKVDGVLKKIPKLQQSSLHMLAANINANSNLEAFNPMPLLSTEIKDLSVVGFGSELVKYFDKYISDYTLTAGEKTILEACQSWPDCASEGKTILAKSVSFVTILSSIPWAKWVYDYWITEEKLLRDVAIGTSLSFPDVTALKKNTVAMAFVLADARLSGASKANGFIETAYFGPNGETLDILSGTGNFIVPAGVTNLNCVLVSKGKGVGFGQQGCIKSVSLAVTPGQSIAYNTTTAGTTFGALDSGVNSITDANSSIFFKAANSATTSASGSHTRSAGGAGGFGAAQGGVMTNTSATGATGGVGPGRGSDGSGTYSTSGTDGGALCNKNSKTDFPVDATNLTPEFKLKTYLQHAQRSVLYKKFIAKAIWGGAASGSGNAADSGSTSVGPGVIVVFW